MTIRRFYFVDRYGKAMHLIQGKVFWRWLEDWEAITTVISFASVADALHFAGERELALRYPVLRIRSFSIRGDSTDY